MENLDLACAQRGQKLGAIKGVKSKDLENLLTESIAVLEEQGLYAAFLYLAAKRKNGAVEVGKQCAEFLRETPREKPLLGNGDVFPALQRLAEDLDGLLFARDLLRQALVYGRYHVKAGGETGG